MLPPDFMMSAASTVSGSLVNLFLFTMVRVKLLNDYDDSMQELCCVSCAASNEHGTRNKIIELMQVVG